MEDIRLIEVKEEILADNEAVAHSVRATLSRHGIVMVNIMASPGGGKTSLIIETIRRLRGRIKIAVIEGDIDSSVDAERMAAEGTSVVQIRTGGACHLDAPMVEAALREMNLGACDLIFVENIGNLVCPAEFDIGAGLAVMITSVPEGDDKPLKYPLMFSVADAVVVNKVDYLPDEGFQLPRLEERVRKLNPRASIFPLSCRTGTGLDAWVLWLTKQMER